MDEIQAAIVAVAADIAAVEQQLKEVQDPEEKKQLRKEKEQLRKEKEQLREEKLLLLRAQAPPPASPPNLLTEADVASELQDLYGKKVFEGCARPPIPHDKILGDELSMLDIGRCFRIVGREETYNVLLEGAAKMFRVFMHPENSATEHMRGRPFMFGMIAYPGAGKTTMGTRGWSFLKEQWLLLTPAKKREILAQHLSAADATAFVNMADASLEYNLVFYSDLVPSPRLEHAELSLGIGQVLGLRCLHSIINVDQTLDYGWFLSEMMVKQPRLMERQPGFTLASVLKFLHQALGLKSTRILVSFFFDEANAVEPDGPGATWFQRMLSAYVAECHKLARDGSLTFPVLSYATTRYTAGSMLKTVSARARSIPVPFRLLTEEESEAAVHGFVARLAESLDVKPPAVLSDSVRYMLRVAGGNPRALATVIEVLAKLSSKQELYKAFVEGTGNDVAESVLYGLKESYRGAYGQYSVRDELLTNVLAVSLTGHARVPGPLVSCGGGPELSCGVPPLYDVTRDSTVVPGMDVVYGHLEDVGLVALTPVSSGDGGVSDLGAVPVKVRCAPALVSAVVSASPLAWPNLASQDYRTKEIADVQTILLRIWLCHHVLSCRYFTLEQILSPGAVIPPALQEEFFTLEPRCSYNIHHHTTVFQTKDDITAAFSSSRCLAILGVGNDGFDSIVKLQRRNNNDPVYLVLESKQTTSIHTRGATDLLNNFRKDCVKFWKIPKPTDDDFVKSRVNRGETSSEPWAKRLRARKNQDSSGQCSSSIEGIEEVFDEGMRINEDSVRIEAIEEVMKTNEDSVQRRSIEAIEEVSDECMEDDDKELNDLIYVFCTNRRASPGFLKDLPRAQDMGRSMRRIIYQCEAEALKFGDALGAIAELRAKKRRLS